ncbi:MAG: hypothetical protein AB7Q37_18865 [Pyrinomonadaceae bacterium]
MALLTTPEFAAAVGLTSPRIIQLLKSGEIQGKKYGRDWMIDDKWVEIVKNRPERRGRPRKDPSKGDGV